MTDAENDFNNAYNDYKDGLGCSWYDLDCSKYWDFADAFYQGAKGVSSLYDAYKEVTDSNNVISAIEDTLSYFGLGVLDVVYEACTILYDVWENFDSIEDNIKSAINYWDNNVGYSCGIDIALAV